MPKKSPEMSLWKSCLLPFQGTFAIGVPIFGTSRFAEQSIDGGDAEMS